MTKPSNNNNNAAQCEEYAKQCIDAFSNACATAAPESERKKLYEEAIRALAAHRGVSDPDVIAAAIAARDS